ncbi:ATP-grasp domain-containing protein [Cohnella soli]|uniref:ATP-grasp domain-containing protein n=1 Tax=Cohnella soli TaxID=425005 RepID=A0ABW0HVW1_9BACL
MSGKVTNVYFNRWFSTAYHYMNMIRDNPDGEQFRFYGTHPDINHMSLQACDHAETEPALRGTAYVDFALDFCRRHRIDLFVPRLNMLDISREIDRFEEIGTRVIACRDADLLEAIVEKDKFYESMAGEDIVTIPDYELAETPEQFRSAYTKLVSRGHRVCFKPTEAEGGMGFRIIDDQLDSFATLYGHVTLAMTFEQAYAALAGAETFPKLMVMEMLEGDEYSIDCLADAEGKLLAAVPRRKLAGRVYEMDAVPELMEIAERIAVKCRIPYVYNVQVKYGQGVPKLLEINPRMSGGLYLTCLTGVNMPYLAVQAGLGRPFEVPKPRYGIRASYVEQAILLADSEAKSGTTDSEIDVG